MPREHAPKGAHDDQIVFTWAWQQSYADAETVLSIRSVPPPAASTSVAQPEPYTRREIRRLWAALDERWPRLPADRAARWLRRFEEGKSPYSRVRAHAIHLQLEAIIN